MELIKMLKEADMSQAELSRRTGIPTSAINSYVKGRYNPKQENELKIMEILSIGGDFMNYKKKEFGIRVRTIRESEKLSMEDFGKKFTPPASKGVVSNWENGYNFPNKERLKKIAEMGNISLDELMGVERACQYCTSDVPIYEYGNVSKIWLDQDLLCARIDGLHEWVNIRFCPMCGGSLT